MSDGINGFVVPIGDVSAAAAAVSELLLDGDLWQRQSTAAKERYRDRFSAEGWEHALLEAHLRVTN